MLLSLPGSDYQLAAITLDAGHARDIWPMLTDARTVLDDLAAGPGTARRAAASLKGIDSPYTLPALIDALDQVTTLLAHAARDAASQACTTAAGPPAASAIDVITQAASTEHDFGGWLAGLLASAAARLGSGDALTAGRPGSWEASLIDEFGLYLWEAMVTGARRGELLAQRENRFDFEIQAVAFTKNYLVRAGQRIEKDTKTGEERWVSLDPLTCDLFAGFFKRRRAAAQEAGVGVPPDAFVSSPDLLGATPWNPDTMTHRYERYAAAVGIDSPLKELRHYSATQLLTNGVDSARWPVGSGTRTDRRRCGSTRRLGNCIR